MQDFSSPFFPFLPLSVKLALTFLFINLRFFGHLLIVAVAITSPARPEVPSLFKKQNQIDFVYVTGSTCSATTTCNLLNYVSRFCLQLNVLLIRVLKSLKIQLPSKTFLITLLFKLSAEPG